MAKPFHKRQLAEATTKTLEANPESIAAVTNAKRVMKVGLKRHNFDYSDHSSLFNLLLADSGNSQAQNELAARIF